MATEHLLDSPPELVLGALLVNKRMQLERAVYHLTEQARLLAIVDLVNGFVSFTSTVLSMELQRAIWSRRPNGANATPKGFFVRTTSELKWLYGSQTCNSVLPSRYRHERVHFRELPRISAEYLTPAHIKLVALLQSGPLTLEEMSRRLGATDEMVEKWLFALYCAEAISMLNSAEV
jgi:hypothetical protein